MGLMRFERCTSLLLLVAALFFGCGRANKPETPASGSYGAASGAAQAGKAPTGRPGQAGARRQTLVPVQATLAQAGILTADRSTAGVVSPMMTSQVATQVAGVVKSVVRVSGDWVKAGDTVVQLDDAQLRLTLANAQAALENARINLSVGQDSSSQASPKLALQLQSAQSALDSAQKFYDAQKALFDLGGISASTLDTAASQLATAKANLEGAKTALDVNGKSGDQTIAQLRLAVTQSQNQLAQAQLNLQNATIKAPFAGQIAAINMQSGMYAGLNTPVFTLVSSGKQVTFSIPPSDAPALPLGAPLSFTYSGKSYPLSVSQSPSAPVSNVIPMVAVSKAALSLPFGSVGSVTYTIPVAQGIIVPLSSIQTLENHNYVFRVVDNRVTPTNVTIIGEAGIMTAVTGLQAGDSVVVSPPPGLIQGSQVQATMIQVGAATGQAGGRPASVPPSGAAPGAGAGPGGAGGSAGQGRTRTGGQGGATTGQP